MSHTAEDLRALQSKTLEEKIQISTARIIEWYQKNGGKVHVAFSGGKDSTVLLDLVRRIYPDVPAIFVDTGLEYPELREFVKTLHNVTWLKPEMSFRKVIEKYGYPLISKEVAGHIYSARNKPNGKTAQRFEDGNSHDIKYGTMYSYAKWKPLKDSCIPISSMCCDIMKKKPAKKYERQTGSKPILGTMASESRSRRYAWMKNGCNSFDVVRPASKPMSFWTEQDVLRYISKFNIPYASVYGEIKQDENGNYYTTGCNRTGCVFCGFGCHLEKWPNRFQRLAITHPQLYDYCMRGGKYDESGKWVPDKGLGMAKVLDFINVKWWNDGDEAKRDEYRAKYKEKELNK